MSGRTKLSFAQRCIKRYLFKDTANKGGLSALHPKATQTRVWCYVAIHIPQHRRLRSPGQCCTAKQTHNAKRLHSFSAPVPVYILSCPNSHQLPGRIGKPAESSSSKTADDLCQKSPYDHCRDLETFLCLCFLPKEYLLFPLVLQAWQWSHLEQKARVYVTLQKFGNE